MLVSRSDVSFRDSIQRDSCVTGANAIASSDAGSGAGVGLRAHEPIARGAGGMPGSTGFQSVAGASVGCERDLPRPGAPLEVRRHRSRASESAAMLPLGRRHRDLHELLGFGERRGRDGGTDAGAVPNVGGAPGVVGVACAGGADAGGVSLLHAAAATRTPSGALNQELAARVHGEALKAE